MAGKGHNAVRSLAQRLPISASSLSIFRLVIGSLLQLTYGRAAPLNVGILRDPDEDLPKSSDDPDLWVYLGTAIALVLLGGAFAGLTIALMGQDEIYLQVIATSGEGAERKHAKKVLNLLKKGKHWVLVTLLLSNVITNETLPIVLDRSLGGGWPAVVSSTVLIVIFGEIAPQSVCVRYGLTIGAWMSPFVLGLMWLMGPIAWPTAKLLDWLLGEDHGTTYKKAGLKTLVTLHKSLGSTPGERLNEDEVTIISAVLDLKEKRVGDIMTPMEDVFVMSADTVLDEEMTDTILTQGYSRIPIYAPDHPTNFIGMLLVKILITYDPQDCLRVRDFALATLPETGPDTSCLDIVNFFQEGKSHMVLVSELPGQDKGALGVLTLEDVIEELIGEEIIDESDVFVDVHRAIRRAAPAPRMKYMKNTPNKETHDAKEASGPEPAMNSPRPNGHDRSQSTISLTTSRQSSISTPRDTTWMMRRRSSAKDTVDQGRGMLVRGNTTDLRQHLKHLGPSNAASRPKTTRYTNVKIKPGVGAIHEDYASLRTNPSRPVSVAEPRDDHGPRMGLLYAASPSSKSETPTVVPGYGSMQNGPPIRITSEARIQDEIVKEPPEPITAAQASELARQNAVPVGESSTNDKEIDKTNESSEGGKRPAELTRRASEVSTIAELPEPRSRSQPRPAARSGSITQNHVEVGGMKKLVLETASLSDDESATALVEVERVKSKSSHEQEQAPVKDDKKKKKKRKWKKNKGTNANSESTSGETSPLLERSK